MFEYFLIENPFKAFTWQHFLPVLLFTIFGFVVILWARSLKNESHKTLLGFGLSLLPPLAVITRMSILSIQGSFSLQEELPLHLCRLVAFIMPAVIWYRNKKWFGILYFLIVAGTLQANITPDLAFGFPHWSYFCYWTIHTLLVVLPFYVLFVFDFTITRKDLINAVIYTNVYLVLITLVNLLLGSNYFYTLAKPKVASILDLMGPWPIYIFVLEFIGFLMFLIVYAPFWIKRRAKRE